MPTIVDAEVAARAGHIGRSLAEEADDQQDPEDPPVVSTGELTAATQRGWPVGALHRGGLRHDRPADRQKQAGDDEAHEADHNADTGD